MRRYLPSALAGLIAPLASYDLARSSSILLAILVVAAVAAAGTAFRMSGGGRPIRLKLWLASIVFSLGALVSQAGLFIRYYVTFGYRDEKLNIGIAIMQLEYAIIAAVGSASVCISLIIQRRLAHTRQDDTGGAR